MRLQRTVLDLAKGNDESTALSECRRDDGWLNDILVLVDVDIGVYQTLPRLQI
jgi:hypothetical protein